MNLQHEFTVTVCKDLKIDNFNDIFTFREYICFVKYKIKGFYRILTKIQNNVNVL